MKKIMNSPKDYVIEMGIGMVQAHPDKLNFEKKYKTFTRKEMRSDKVVLISGGGSGHEPAHGGFVGEGLLDVAVCGDVFASPSSVQIYKAIVNNKSNKGTLLIVKNYSGDIMNFNIAADMAQEEGVYVETVYVDDDVAVNKDNTLVGRRGVAGTLFIHKIAGAAAEAGKSLPEVKAIAEKVIQNVKSIGFAFTSCTVPAKGTPTFSLSDDEMEFGVGIHGEPGISRDKIMEAKSLSEKMYRKLSKELDLMEDDEIVLMVNGMGATPISELYILNHDFTNLLNENKINIHKTMVGNYMTSLDMAGASISILKLDNELKTLFDAKADSVTWNM